MYILAHAGKEEFPNACAEKFAHGMDPAVPVVKVTHYADSLGVRRPNCKVNAAFAIECAQMGAELVVDSPMLPLGKQIQIRLAHDRAVPIRIACGPLRSGMRGEMKLVI